MLLRTFRCSGFMSAHVDARRTRQRRERRLPRTCACRRVEGSSWCGPAGPRCPTAERRDGHIIRRLNHASGAVLAEEASGGVRKMRCPALAARRCLGDRHTVYLEEHTLRTAKAIPLHKSFPSNNSCVSGAPACALSAHTFPSVRMPFLSEHRPYLSVLAFHSRLRIQTPIPPLRPPHKQAVNTSRVFRHTSAPRRFSAAVMLPTRKSSSVVTAYAIQDGATAVNGRRAQVCTCLTVGEAGRHCCSW